MTEMKEDVFHDAHREQRLTLFISLPSQHSKKFKAILKRRQFYAKSFYFYGKISHFKNYFEINLLANSTAGQSLD